MSKASSYTVTVHAVTDRAVFVKIDGMGIKAWLPRSRVVFPEGIQRHDVLEVEVPSWIIRNEIGEPF